MNMSWKKVLVVGALVAWAQADVIYLVDGSKLENVEMRKERFDLVEFMSNDLQQRVPPEQVLEITRDRAPTNYRKGFVAYKSGDYDEAVDRFESCADERDEWVRAYALYYKGLALKKRGSHGAAASAFGEFVETFSEHLFVVDAMFYHGEALLADGDARGAEDAFDQCVEFGMSNDVDKAKLSGKFGKGMSQLAAGNPSDARRSFDDAVREGLTNEALADLVARANLYSGRTYLEEGRWDQAQRHFEGILREGGSPLVLAGVYNGLGRAYAELGGDENTRAAQLAYLRVVLLFANQREEYLTGLRGAIETSRALNENDRAAELEAELQRAGG